MLLNNMITVGVIGVGKMGNHHARILSALKNCKLGGVSDRDEKKAEKSGKEFKVDFFSNYQHLLSKIQACVIAVPTPLHYQIGKECLERGIHCLIEKPLCEKVEEAEELIQVAQEKNLILQVGHIERFNPAVLAAQEYVKNPKFIEVNRLGPYDPRVSHIGVVLDLMIHDLDIVLYLLNSEVHPVREKPPQAAEAAPLGEAFSNRVKNLEAFGAKVISDHEDIVKCRLRFENGCIVDLSASRVSLEHYRKIRIFQQDAYLSIDYGKKDLKIYRRKSPVLRSFSDIEILKPRLVNEEPLKLELEHFLHCVESGKKPHVSGEHGRDALELGWEILQQLHLHE